MLKATRTGSQVSLLLLLLIWTAFLPVSWRTASSDESPPVKPMFGTVGDGAEFGAEDEATKFDPLKKGNAKENDETTEDSKSDNDSKSSKPTKKKTNPLKKAKPVAKVGVSKPAAAPSKLGGSPAKAGGAGGASANGGGNAVTAPGGLAGLAAKNAVAQLTGNTNGSTAGSGSGANTAGQSQTQQATGSPGTSSPAASGTKPSTAKGVTARLVDLTNEARQQNAEGIPELSVNATLMKMAQEHSAAMAAANTMSHDVGGAFGDRLKNSGYAAARGGENIAAGQKSPEEAIRDWMNSPGHRANILNSQFTEIGVGVAQSSNGTLYWTQVFGRPVSAAAR